MGKRLWSFRGGMRLPGHKSLSAEGEIRAVPLPDKLVLALRQHSGQPAIPLVEAGDRVKKGQCIARAAEGISAALHAPTSGTITAITAAPLAHPSGESDMCIHLCPDGEDEWCRLSPIADPLQAPIEELVTRIAETGVVGLGGAVFPSAIKLDPKVQPEILIINGVECEPYITCDDMLMRKRPGDILHGIAVLLHVTGARQCFVGIEDNKPKALAEMQSMHRELLAKQLPGMERVEIVAVPTRFPAGGEKQLIYTLTGREVPSGKLPRDIGVVCNNVGTAAAIHDAVFKGRPLLSRIVTLTGEALPSPANFEVLIGTPVATLLKLAGLEDASNVELVMGGPMMGFPISSAQVAINKGSNCILARPHREQNNAEHAPCIRCGTCVTVCPASLLPQQLYWYARARKFDKSEAHHLFDCIECGCCAHVCPSHIPLVEYFRFAKHAVADQRKRQRKAEIARQRNESRLARLEKEKQEKEAARAKRRAARKAASKKTTISDAKTDAPPMTAQKVS
jgi:electron transport complex protein RnfC